MPSGVGAKYFPDINGSMEALKSTVEKKYQAIVFQKQNSANAQEFQRRHLHPYPAPDYPFNHSFPDLLRHSRPVEAPGIPQLGQISPQFSLLPRAEGLEKNSYTQSSQYQVHNILGIPCLLLVGVY